MARLKEYVKNGRLESRLSEALRKAQLARSLCFQRWKCVVAFWLDTRQFVCAASGICMRKELVERGDAYIVLSTYWSLGNVSGRFRPPLSTVVAQKKHGHAEQLAEHWLRRHFREYITYVLTRCPAYSL